MSADILGDGMIPFLLAEASVTNVVDQRVYTDQLKTNAPLPALLIGATEGEWFDHLGSGTVGLAMQPLHVYSYDATRPAADALDVIVQNALSNYHGPFGNLSADVFCRPLGLGFRGSERLLEGSSKLRYYTRSVFAAYF